MSTFTVTRALHIDAPRERVHSLVDDLREWQAWSPWEGMDPALERTYTGPVHGAGARYAWRGNRKAGAGAMQITRSEPGRIDVDLEFTKPFRARNDVTFDLTEVDGGTRVTWTMSGHRSAVMHVVGRVMKIDEMLGRDFEKGLAALKATAERA